MSTDHTNVDFNVRINGNNVTTYNHEGKTFVEGRVDTEYALHIKNRNPFRVKVILSVDQVNVINGKPSSGASDETGYILDAGESQTILGYRVNDDTVAKFKFTKAEASYAQADKEMTGTTGVLGCRVFKEKVAAPIVVTKEIHHHHSHWNYPNHYWYGTYTTPTWGWGSCTSNVVGTTTATLRGNAATTLSLTAANGTIGSATCNNMSFTASNASNGGEGLIGGSLSQTSCMAMADEAPFSLGSTFGQKAESKVTSVSFVVDHLLGDIAIYYSTRAGLISLGVDVTKKPKVAFPEAFSGQYAKPPKGWLG